MHCAFHLSWCVLCLVLITGCNAPRGEPLRSPKALCGDSAPRATQPAAKRASHPSAEDIASAHASFANAVILEMNGETEAALDGFWQAAQEDPASEWLVLEVSRRFMQHKRLDEAQQLLERAAAQPGASGAVLARLAMVYSQLGKHDAAIQMSRASIRKNPSSLGAYQGLFFNYLHAGRPADALKAINEASSVAKPTAEFLIGLSELYASYGIQNPAERDELKPKAIALLAQARKLNPAEPTLKLKLADGFSSFGDNITAAEIYNELLIEAPDSELFRENVHTKLANIYLRASDRKQAREQLEALVKSDPTNPQPYFFLGHLAVDDKKLAEAAECFAKTVILNPEFEEAYYELANVQLALDKPSDALATIEKARKKFPANYFMEFAAGIANARLKNFDKALSNFTAAEVMGNATTPPRVNHFFYFQLGIAYEQKGDYEDAARAFEKCLSLSPEFDEAMNYLGYMWADRGENLDKALGLLRKAVAKEPKNPAYLDSLGWVFFKLNRLQDALDNIQKAVDLSEEPDATLYEHLGDVLQAMGNHEKAREAWTKALKIEPKESLKQKLGAAGGSEAPR